jgi:hypothetical protein
MISYHFRESECQIEPRGSLGFLRMIAGSTVRRRNSTDDAPQQRWIQKSNRLYNQLIIVKLNI